MSRYRLQLSPAQQAMLLGHCAHARYVWNLCVEQESQWRPGRGRMPGFTERCRQLSEARAENLWLAAGSAIVQQQAIRDHAQAMAGFFAGTRRRPSWRKAGRDEGFRIVQVRPGDWHVAFAAIPGPVPPPSNGEVVGLDRGVAVAAALSTGELLCCPVLTARQRQRRRRLERKLARARRGADRRGAAGSSSPSPGSGPVRLTGARTGARKPRLTWPGALT